MLTAARSKTSDDVTPPLLADKLIVLTIEYAGARYQGMQLQKPGVPTIQGEIEDALLKLTGQHYRIAAAGRTDSGGERPRGRSSASSP